MGIGPLGGDVKIEVGADTMDEAMRPTSLVLRNWLTRAFRFQVLVSPKMKCLQSQLNTKTR